MAKILIIGDIILDHYILGNVERISPEAPIPVLDYTEEFYRLGGAANVANNLHLSEHEVKLMGVGGISNFKIFDSLISNKSFNSAIDLTNGSFLVKSRIASNNHHYFIRIDRGTEYENSFHDLNIVEKEIQKSDIIVLSDYCKGTITPDLIYFANRYKHRKKFIIDSKQYASKKIYIGAYLITPNTNELKKLLNTQEIDDRLIYDFMETYNILNLLHTQASEGMTLYYASSGIINKKHYPTVVSQVYDVTGAGDTVVANIAECLANGTSLQEAVETANLAASIVIQKFGTST